MRTDLSVKIQYKLAHLCLPLGGPKGAATRKGWTFRPEFERASVFVNVEMKAAEIDWT